MAEYNYVDLSYLESMSDGSKDIIVEMIDIFKSQVPEFIQNMNTFLENKDYESLGKEAHKAKSSVAIMGMHEVVEELKNLELNAKEGKSPELYPEIVETFATICQLALEELDEILPTL